MNKIKKQLLKAINVRSTVCNLSNKDIRYKYKIINIKTYIDKWGMYEKGYARSREEARDWSVSKIQLKWKVKQLKLKGIEEFELNARDDNERFNTQEKIDEYIIEVVLPKIKRKCRIEAMKTLKFNWSSWNRMEG